MPKCKIYQLYLGEILLSSWLTFTSIKNYLDIFLYNLKTMWEKHEDNTKSKEEAEEKAKCWREDKDNQDYEEKTSKKEQDDEEIISCLRNWSNYSSF
jgi:hypothetical protein